jgi:hypothetical protein
MRTHAGRAPLGLIPKAVILLAVDRRRTLRRAPHRETGYPPALLWQREIRLALIGPLVNLALACLSAVALSSAGRGADLWKWPFLQAGNLPKSLVWANFMSPY